MRNILKHHSGTPSGTCFSTSKFAQNWHFSRGGKNPRFLETSGLDRENLGLAITFILLDNFIESMGLFDIFKDKDEDEDSGGMAEETPSSEPEPEETPSFESKPEPEETPSFESKPEETAESRDETPSTESAEETTSYSQPAEETTSYSQS